MIQRLFKSHTVNVAILLLLFGSALKAQIGSKAPSDDEAPKAALLTERGKQLWEERKLLKKNLESMGSKHPNRPGVEAKIEAIEEQLQAWEPAPNPFRAGSDEPTSPQMNDYDLRQVVIRLTKRVEALEKRVSVLEAEAKR
ncbi:hypothetical protein LOC67_12805 [Stieleria sp. JC731]|uniref:hypothetical protein n=1 Tax=Pirellulaceae TaxID=2691357 RepID=UPI001E485481|nr:hypothetical protein [Stieleria sp. JC731]MCC9601428.1 hypothetical protein [Stieleria sp. JC731]